MPGKPDRFLLTEYHVAMRNGDRASAAHAWEALAVNNWDRIQQTVKLFRFSAGGKGIPVPDQGSAASVAFIRVLAMGAKFESLHIGAYQAALIECVRNACRDFGRGEFRHTKRSAGSLDLTWEDSEAGPYSRALAIWDAERREQSEQRITDELHKDWAAEFVAWGISQIKNNNYREVLELTYIEKLEAEEISSRLGISMDNVYARRSRGVRELGKILREHAA